MCPEELDVGVVVVQEGNDKTPGLVSFLDFEQLVLQSALCFGRKLGGRWGIRLLYELDAS